MRLQRPNFLLNLTLRDTCSHARDLQLGAYGSDLQALEVNHTAANNLYRIEISTYLPNKVILKVLGIDNHEIELISMSLAGLRFSRDALSKVVEYKETNSLQELETTPSTKTLKWTRNGCMIVDCFNPDPFAYHLYVGNKIKML